jgi:glycosyltransferase involved in cell wall biosynthesis
MEITVITVCLNAEKTIERTFQSVIVQTEKQFEYLIIDGKSTDNTIDIIKKWESRFREAGIVFRWLSEQDSGLYDAMNKGAEFAKGDWLLYMNADDEFADEKAIEKALKYLQKDADVLYGNTIFVNGSQEEFRKALPIETIRKHLPFIPQSAFVKSDIQRRYGFDVRYELSTDYECFLRMYLGECNFVQTDVTFSKFHAGGVSTQDVWKVYKDDINVKHKYQILNKYSPIQLMKYIRKYIVVKIAKRRKEIGVV